MRDAAIGYGLVALFYLLLRGFAEGCAAMTGTEAISNGVQAFKSPESKNASRTLVAMAVLLGVMFLGTSVLAYLDPGSGSMILQILAGGVAAVASGPLGAEPLLVQVGYTRFALRRVEAAAAQPVFMAHGAGDPVIPQAAGLHSAALLRQLGFTVDWHSYPMAHAVCQDEVRDIGDWLSRRFSGG